MTVMVISITRRRTKWPHVLRRKTQCGRSLTGLPCAITGALFRYGLLVMFCFLVIAMIHRNMIANLPQTQPKQVTAKQTVHLRTGDQFRIEPLLIRNAPSVELNTQIILNTVHASKIANMISTEGNISAVLRKGIYSGKDGVSIYRKVSTEDYVNNVKKVFSLCPPVPPNLLGKVFIDAEHSHNYSLQDVVRQNPAVGKGGHWQPDNCTFRHNVAIIIPYRDRWKHLVVLLGHLHPLLQRQQLNYRIYVVEQYGNDTFNKGAIMNAAFTVALGKENHHCFVFHDVDLIPEDDRNMYSCSEMPRHMSVAVDELGYRLPYKVLVGGVFVIKSEHFFKVNGYSNMYWGWGGEDDDMGYRVQQAGLTITRPPEWLARYTMIKHVKRKPLVWKVRNKLLRTSGRRYRLDGLNTARYKLVSVHEDQVFTHIMVDVGHPPTNIKQLQEAETKS